VGKPAVDGRDGRIFIPSPDTGTVEVFDWNTRSFLSPLPVGGRPDWCFFIEPLRRLVVGESEAGRWKVFEAGATRPAATFPCGSAVTGADIDWRHRLYVGLASRSLAVINVESLEREEDIELPAVPGVLAAEKSGGRVYVSWPDENQIAVVDKGARTVDHRVPMPSAYRGVLSLAIDQLKEHLHVGSDRPSGVLLLETTTRRWLTGTEILHPPNEILFDEVHGYLVVASGRGFLHVFTRGPLDFRYEELLQQRTAPGSSRLAHGLEVDQVYLVAPRAGVQAGSLWAFWGHRRQTAGDADP
jgi:hypothetical protein